MPTLQAKDKILFCGLGDERDIRLEEAVTRADSFESCLLAAVSLSFGLIVVWAGEPLPPNGLALQKLLGRLKSAARTAEVPILILLPCRHRLWLKRFQAAGADYVRFYTADDLLSGVRMKTLLRRPTAKCRLKQAISDICEHIEYRAVGRHQEILFCRAYRNRLVLGPLRLRQSCETAAHRYCEYFRQPRLPAARD